MGVGAFRVVFFLFEQATKKEGFQGRNKILRTLWPAGAMLYSASPWLAWHTAVSHWKLEAASGFEQN